MNIKDIGELNTERFLNDAFEPTYNPALLKAALLRRNIYLAFFITGTACIFITAFTSQILLCILSLGFSTLSLVVMTKYDTQVFFLRIIQLRTKEE